MMIGLGWQNAYLRADPAGSDQVKRSSLRLVSWVLHFMFFFTYLPGQKATYTYTVY